MKRVGCGCLVVGLLPILAGCSVGPDYVRATAPVATDFKELKGWKRATPNDVGDHGAWWTLFRDPTLNALVSKVEISNQTVAAQAAAYEESQAIIREAQSNFLPSISGSYSATRSGTGAGQSTAGRTTARTTYTPGLSGTWSIDLWGKIRRQVESNTAAAQVSAADLANAKLSAQAQLAIAYFNLRAEDSLRAILHETVDQYKKTLEISQNQYNVGTTSKADLITAQTQLLSAQAQEIGTGVQRAQYEHAIAVLTGEPPANLSIPRRALEHGLPGVPVGVPSTLLERRPDIAAAERLMQEQNALIGVAEAAYYPTLTLSGALSFSGANAFPITAANEIWSLGAAASDTLLDGGARAAAVDAASATYKQSVATYRQTVLTAFQQVEDYLVAIRLQSQQLKIQEQAVKAAREAVDVYLNQYRVGTVPFTTVVVAESTLLSAQEAALTTRQNLFVATVNLIEALGGGWSTAKLPDATKMDTQISLLPKPVATP
jgi:NodT family efflux transporter outer membrane factor (OMF) lipoprotein